MCSSEKQGLGGCGHMEIWPAFCWVRMTFPLTTKCFATGLLPQGQDCCANRVSMGLEAAASSALLQQRRTVPDAVGKHCVFLCIVCIQCCTLKCSLLLHLNSCYGLCSCCLEKKVCVLLSTCTTVC